MWVSHLSFPNIVRDAWANPSSLLHAVSKFTNKAKVWNRNVFGNLFHRKKCILARLRGVQIALSNNPNNFLVWLEQDLCTELSKVSKLKEEYWAIKSRITWLVEGDRNIAFYHTSALVCWAEITSLAWKTTWETGWMRREILPISSRLVILSYLCPVTVAPSSLYGIPLARTSAWRRMRLPSLLFRYPMRKLQALSGLLKLSKPRAQMASMRGFFSAFSF